MNREQAEKILFQSHGDESKALQWALHKLETVSAIARKMEESSITRSWGERLREALSDE